MLLFTRLYTCTVLAILASTALAGIQSPNARGNSARANAVKSLFASSYADYKRYCFGHDQLNPLTKTCADPLGGWGATIVDVQSTAKIMGLNDIYNECVAQSLRVDYTKTSQDQISIFETTIRHVGGLLSSYELGGKTNQKLVDQAVVVADRLLHGWVGNNALPYNGLRNWNTNPTPVTDQGAIIAETGTLILEFDRLSKYSNNATFRNFAAKAMRATINASPLPFPGLNPQGIDPATNKPRGDYVTWGGGSDSYFEYLIKASYLNGNPYSYMPAWVRAVNSSIAHLMTTAGGNTTRKDLLYLADYSASSGGLIPRSSHLECFHGGNWMLGGKLLGNDDIFQYGLRLTDACINTYTSSASGIGPESFVYASQSGSTNGVKIRNPDFYRQHGFDYDSKYYVLRPEVLESVFYAYRLTGDKKWQDLAWAAFKNIRNHCKAPAALAALSDVTQATPPQIDDSESFLYAELLKYLYLIFADPSTIDLGEWVFNTEAHPFRLDRPGVTFPQLNPGSRLAKPGSPFSPTSSAKPSTASATKSVPLPKFSSNPDAGKVVQGILKEVFGGVGQLLVQG